MAITILEDRLAIRDLIENWAIWRDAAEWERLRTVWHSDGMMVSTFFSGSADDFIQASEIGWKRGVAVVHFLGGSSVDIIGSRAIAQTKMTISQRADVEGVSCDCVCTGRFYDFFEKRDDRWGLVLRQPIYEKDRLDPVDSSASVVLDQDKLAGFPVGYRYLAYAQTAVGLDVNLRLPQARGAEIEALYEKGRQWLQAGPLAV